MATFVRDLQVELGLLPRSGFYRDRLFLAAIIAGFVVTIAFRLFLPGAAIHQIPAGFLIFFNWVIWSPILEELLFRGVIQGQLSRLWNRSCTLLGLSCANWVTSALFTGLHFVHHPPLWAAAVFLPSLVFGYFRDRHGSILPSITMHAIYNAQFLLVLGWL